jgi:TolB-like protein/DNA-binding winged helix-turn-helix (wHTH) protein/tetratricopeptide (TPR) repeat protein
LESGLSGKLKSMRFGSDFEVDTSTLELWRAGRALKVERIPVQVLLVLIEHKGQLVTRELIAEKVWGRNTFLDTDNSINVAVRKIRQVLKDDPVKPRFLETIPGRGYRFIAPVANEQALSAEEPARFTSLEEIDHHEPEPRADTEHFAVSETPAIERSGARRAGLWVAVASFCVLGTVGWLAWHRLYGERTRPIRSIAVLPLQNLSGDPSQEYFADGMTEELITELSRIQSLRVISHTSVMDYKGTRKHLPQIAQELGVDAILEGSVIRENNQIRVTVQLLDGPDDRHLWSEEYEQPLHGILNLQREVAHAVSREVRVKLTPQQQARLNSTKDVAPEAYEAYLRGRYLLSTQFTMGQPLMQAKNYFEEAIRKDPSFAPAYVGLADAYVYLALFRQTPQEEAFRSAKESLRKAEELDNSIGEIHDTLGIIGWRHDWDWAGTERELDQAIAMAPSYDCAHEDRATYLALLGRRDDALAEIAKIKELDFGPGETMTEESVFYQLRDYQSLVRTSQRGVASDPNGWVQHLNLGVGYEGIGKMSEATAEYQRALQLSNGDRDAFASVAHAYAVTGKRAEAEKILRDFEQKSRKGDASPYIMATIYAGLGEKDKAFEFLEKAYRDRNLELSWHLKADVRLDSLRSDPRFESLAQRIGIPLGSGIGDSKSSQTSVALVSSDTANEPR